jgi:hypothetical protein
MRRPLVRWAGPRRCTADFGSLEARGGTIVEAAGRVRRFRFAARADVDTSPTAWALDGSLSVKGRGFGRIILFFTGWWLRSQIAAALDQFWADSAAAIDDAEQQLLDLDKRVKDAGGEAAFVRHALWVDRPARQ